MTDRISSSLMNLAIQTHHSFHVLSSMGTSCLLPTLSIEPNTEKIKQRLLKKGVFPTPKIVHTLRKKQIQKSKRRSSKTLEKTQDQSQTRAPIDEDEARFRAVSREYRTVMKEFDRVSLLGKPWERAERVGLREIASANKEYGGEKLKGERLEELREMLVERSRADLRWVLDDDLEEGGGGREFDSGTRFLSNSMRGRGDGESIRLLVDRLTTTDLSMRDWKFSRLMNQSGLHFAEGHLLRIVGGLGARGNWNQALAVVEWVYNNKVYKHHKSRFVYTKLLAVLGKARRPGEALRIFNIMREDCQIYPDMVAYHSIAVTLGQAGLVRELLNIIECMRQKPSKIIKNMHRRSWDPRVEPDIVIFNAVLNACVPTQQWKGVSWVLSQIRHSGLKPTGATYGLAMEVMLKSGKYDLVHKFFGKMRRSGAAPKALTYKVLVRTFWNEGKVDEAVEAVRDMEQRGVVGTASVYYELACCLCKNGRWQEAMFEIEKLKKLSLTKPLAVAFTGMIQSCMDGGHVYDCISIFEHMKGHCAPNIGTINAILKVYARNDMFSEAKKLFEMTKKRNWDFQVCLNGGSPLTPDVYTYSTTLEASAHAHQWEYFEYVYKEMALSGYMLDQNKHAWAFVEASRAGKWHLLEHAFDTILEAGEIPHVSLFTEMICQAIALQNYERTIPLINSMAHASLQVSEKQWTYIFRRNGNRFGTGNLQKLLNFLQDSNLVAETPVLNLLKSLNSLCGPRALTDSFELTFHGIDVANGNLNANRNPPNDDLYHHTYKSSLEEDDGASVLSSVSVDHSDTDMIPCGSSEDDNMETELDLLTGRNDDSQGSEVPSASEILEAWKENRRKDGIFFPSQL